MKREGDRKQGGQKLREETTGQGAGSISAGDKRRSRAGARARTEEPSERWKDRLAAPWNTGSRWLWTQLHQCPDAQQNLHNKTGTGTPGPRHKPGTVEAEALCSVTAQVQWREGTAQSKVHSGLLSRLRPDRQALHMECCRAGCIYTFWFS